MKVLALGGCGDMGRHAVAHLVKNPHFDEITIADINGDAARKLADQYGDNVKSIQLNALDQAKLFQVLKASDIVINTTGPFYKFGPLVLQSAIEAKCHYLDINDDWEPTLEQMALDEMAKDAGVISVIGGGGSPGISNILAQAALEQLDSVKELYVCLHMDGVSNSEPSGMDLPAQQPSPEDGPSAVAVHGIHQVTGNVTIVQNGELDPAKAFSVISFPDHGLNLTSGHIIGHPEPLTFKRYHPSLMQSACLFVGQKADLDMMSEMVGMVNEGVLTVEQAAMGLEHAMATKEPKNLKMAGDPESGEPPLLLVVAVGEKDGKAASVAATMNAMPGPGMGAMTGVPVALFAELLLEGIITKTGVNSPDAVVSPMTFFDRLAPLCTPSKTDSKSLVNILPSWKV